MNKKKLILRIPPGAISGYKKIIDKTIPILDKNFELTIVPLGGDFCSGFPYKVGKIDKNNFYEDEIIINSLILDRYSSLGSILPDKKNLKLFTMWESSLLPRFPIEELNYFINETVVPSNWNFDVFKNSGVKKVQLLPLFVDNLTFNHREKKDLSKFTFSAGGCSSISSGNGRRKNFQIILSAFKKCFKGVKDVEIIFKLSPQERDGLGKTLDERIKFNYGSLTDLEIADFLGQSDVFVSGSKAEGWGFFQIESLAVGKPVITVDYGGVKDFCNKDNCFFVDFEENLADGAWGKNGGLWAEMKEESLVEQMRFCYENKDLIRGNSKNYSNSVIEKFSLDNYENNLLKILK